MILAFLSLTLGLIQYRFYDFIVPDTTRVVVPLFIEYTPLTMVVIGVLITIGLYATTRWQRMNYDRNPVYRLLKAKYFLDALFTRVIAERVILPLSSGVSRLEKGFSISIEGTGKVAMGFGGVLRRIENGVVEYYFVFLIAGVAILMLLLELLGGI